MVKIKDIYAGKPDAKDEVEVEGSEYFLESYIEPINFNVDSLISGTNYFITGFKGTGKTALLYYLDSCIKKRDPIAYSSFIFFKEDISATARQEMEIASQRMTSFVSIDRNVLIDGNDFEALWRWLIYQRVWEDNMDCNNGLFLEDDEWRKFDKLINRIPPTVKRKLSIPQRLELSVPVTQGEITYSPTVALDFTTANATATEPYRKFLALINEIDDAFANLHRTDIPYYIFVDELEAYFGDEKVFKRDLCIIRDLIFTVKKLNIIMKKFSSSKTKIICSIRREILNAINRFIVTKELNKVTSGFDVPMVWNYTNTNSFNHPIVRILIKRIQISEKQVGNCLTESEVAQKWFPEKIDSSDPANYILNNSWNKPRDIVRLILSAQACLCSDYSSFNQSTFDMLRKNYSTESLNEIREEMRALYSEKAIDEIITCFTGYNAYFKYDDLNERIQRNFHNSILATELHTTLSDLYRLGFIGNYMPSRKSYRWLHKGDEQLLLSDEWCIMVHPALHSALSIRNFRTKFKSDKKDVSSSLLNNKYTVIVIAIALDSIDVEFIHGDIKYKGRIKAENLQHDIRSYKLGTTINAKIIKVNRNNKCQMDEII